MRPIAKRCLAYGFAAPLVAGLSYLGFAYQVPPDPEHALTQAEIKLRFASKLPAHRPDGAVVPARVSMIADAVSFIDEAERLAAATARSVEFRAYSDYLRGDVKAAAAGYSKARSLAADAAQRGQLALAEGRMLALAGDDEAALAALRTAVSLSELAVPSATLESARILQRQQHAPEAVAAATSVVENQHTSDQDLIETGLLLESLSRVDIAATAYARAARQSPIANYFGARLKAQLGDVDNALGMLECAVKDTGTMVRTLVERDPAVWQACVATDRFRKLFPEMEPALPGR